MQKKIENEFCVSHSVPLYFNNLIPFLVGSFKLYLDFNS